MSNLKFTILILGALCLLPLYTHAQAVITEIMYDPTGSDSGHEWIEIYNAGTSSIKLSDWRVFEGGTNHKIKSVLGDGLLLPQTYAVIADKASQFRIDFPQYTGVLFDSAFSLGNDGDTIVLRDNKLHDIDSVMYQSSLGAAGDGNSLQRSFDKSAAFAPHTPSVGLPMSSDVIAPKVVVVPPPTIKKAFKTVTRKNTTSVTSSGGSILDTSAITEEGTAAAATEVVAAASAPPTNTSNNGSLWSFGIAGAVVLIAASVVASRHAKKHEWDIVEESPEDV